MTNQPKIIEVRDIRAVSDTDGKTYQVADVMYEGATLPVSIPLYELHGVDVDRLAYFVDAAMEDDVCFTNTTAAPLNRVTRIFPSAQELAKRVVYDQTPVPSDMPVINFDTVKEIKF